MDKREGGVSRFSVESFMSHSAEKFRRGILLSFINFGYRKVLGIREVEGGGVSRFSVEIVVSHGTEKFCWGKILCIRKFWLWKKFFAWEGDIRILGRKFLSHSTESLRRRPVLCFKKIHSSKIFMDRRGRGASWFCRKFFVSQECKTS